MLVSLLLSLSFTSFAQQVKLDAENTGDTTISIRRGQTPEAEKKPKFEIVENTEELSGDAAPLKKAAQKNWKDACATWKKETRELNKDNKVISMNCGKMECSTSAMESVCQSNAKSKIRVALDE